MQVSARIDASGARRLEERTAPSLGRILDPKQEEVRTPRFEESAEGVAPAGDLAKAYYSRLAEPGASSERWAEGGTPTAAPTASASIPVRYAPLHLLSGHAFGRSVLLAEELALLAADGGCPAAAIADPMTLGGAAEFAKACREAGVKPLVGASVTMPEGGELVLLARNKAGYRSLSHLLTACHLEEPRQFPLGSWARLERHAEGLLCLTGGDVGPLDRRLVRKDLDGALSLVERLVSLYGRENVWLEVERGYLPWSRHVERRLDELAERTGTRTVAGGAVTHGRRSHFPAQDAHLCAESLCLLDDVIGRKARRHPSQPQPVVYPERSLNAERFLRTGTEMAALFCDRPDLLEATLRVADRCEGDVLPGRQPLPSMFPDDAHALREIVESEAFTAYGSGLTDVHRKRLAFEVDRIQRMGFASHFLVAWDFCRWAREQAIGLSGRGSVVDSAVAYVLGFSEIDAVRHDLHFDRFLPEDGSKRPDIDVDFEAGRRDDVRGYVVRRHGVDRVAGLAAVQTYRARGIVREVGKAFGLPPETVGFLAKRLHEGVSAATLEESLHKRPELRESKVPKERFRWVFALAEWLVDLPTGIGLHSAGVIVSGTPLADSVPVVWSASPVSPESGVDDPHFRMIQWDKRSAKRIFDKFDVLCLRGQDVIGGVERRVQRTDLDFSSKRVDATTDPEVYRAMRSGELVGIPQSASPAMRQAHQRLGTEDLHDASMVQAGIRPGVGGAVKLNELIARRRGKPFSFEHPDLEAILGHTYGIVVFQEQIDQILQRVCGYSAGEAEDIRDAVYKRRREGFAESMRETIVAKAIESGYPPGVADAVYETVRAFNGYAFAQGHALAFAEVSLRSVSLMQNRPAEYFASLLSAQPAGYYGPCTLSTEARSRGVRILPLDVNRSRHRFEVEDAHDEATGLAIPGGAIRVGLMQLSGLSAKTRDRILEAQDGALGDHSERPRQPMQGQPSGGGVALAEMGDPGSAGLWKSAGLRAFGSLFDLAAKTGASRDELEALVMVGALDSLCPNRRAMLWAVEDARKFAGTVRAEGPSPALPLDFEEPRLDLGVEDFDAQEKAVHERALLGMDVARHLMAFERERVGGKGGLVTAEARRLPSGTKAMVVGNPIRLRFPPTPSGKRVVFFDLEDETGLLNCTMFDRVYQRDGHAVVCSPYVTVVGRAQDRDGHTAFLVERAFPYRPVLMRDRASVPVGTADFLAG